MKLVVDANILFSVLIKKGINANILFKQDIHVPEFIFNELLKHVEYLKNKTSRTEENFNQIIGLFKDNVNIVSSIEILPFIKQAAKFCPDPDDVPYFALALKLKCPIWSNDKELKQQNKVKVYSTEELMNIF